MRTALIVFAACLTASPCLAQELVGCDKFKWPLDQERAILTGAEVPTAASGSTVAHPLPAAVSIALVPFAEAKLPVAPERAPKSPTSFAGFVQLPAPATAGIYKITLSSEGWIDVVQDGHLLKSAGFTGALGCAGIRKSVRFDLAAQPFTIELSGIAGNAIRIAITKD
jgi:hypothetical protein